jgi:hypothetical protein
VFSQLRVVIGGFKEGGFESLPSAAGTDVVTTENPPMPRALRFRIAANRTTAAGVAVAQLPVHSEQCDDVSRQQQPAVFELGDPGIA